MSQGELQSLDKAQRELNQVLEHLGRLLVATKGGNRSTVLTTANGLKQALPATTRNYHEALDELDKQLQYAKLVLRRDLAIATEKPEEAPVVDTIVKDASPVKEEPTTVKTEPLQAQESIEDQPVSTEGDSKPLPADANREDVAMDTTVDVKQELKLDTTQAPQTDTKDTGDSTKPPDTAISNSADMDSLFNDPISAGVQKDGSASASASFDFGADANASHDFDFGGFTAGLESGTADESLALIPGLQGFNSGNADASTEPDFSDLFGPPDGSQTVVNESQPADEFNFDDIMDFSTTMPENTSSNDFDIDFS